ncbi:MAG: hypothetical protein NTX05_05155 [Fusobacteria bacterium]|nr:hypothetical protein [Fusobacteriota bacterium]
MKNNKLSWIAVCFATCMGAGVLFLPNEIGKSGIYAFIISLPIAFFINYFGQKYIGKLVVENSRDKECSYSDVIEKQFGKIGGKILVVAFLLVMLGIISMYVTGFKNDLFAFSKSENIGIFTSKDSLYFILIITIFFSLIIVFKQFLLYVVMRIKSIFIMAALLIFSLCLIPYWNFSEFSQFPSVANLIMGVLLILPIVIMAINYFAIISEMVFTYKKEGKSQEVMMKDCRDTLFFSQLLIVVFIGFFVVSSTLALTPAEMDVARLQSQTALSVLDIPGLSILAKWLGLLILPASFLGAFVGLSEPLKNMLTTKRSKNNTRVKIVIAVLSICFVFIVLLFNLNILEVVGIFITPIIAILTYVLPVILMKKSKIHMSKGAYVILILGVLLLVSYFIGSTL